MTSRSYTFAHSIAQPAGPTIVDDLRAVDMGTPSLSSFRRQHTDYVDALRSTGAAVEVLPPRKDFPDSVFVEDVTLCLLEGAVVMRLDAPSRFGEARAMGPHPGAHHDEIHATEEPRPIQKSPLGVCVSPYRPLARREYPGIEGVTPSTEGKMPSVPALPARSSPPMPTFEKLCRRTRFG